MEVEGLKWVFTLRACWLLFVRGPSKDACHTTQNKEEKPINTTMKRQIPAQTEKLTYTRKSKPRQT